jgi:hypothetical protein
MEESTLDFIDRQVLRRDREREKGWLWGLHKRILFLSSYNHICNKLSFLPPYSFLLTKQRMIEKLMIPLRIVGC